MNVLIVISAMSQLMVDFLHFLAGRIKTLANLSYQPILFRI
jgi:hypothetical protein